MNEKRQTLTLGQVLYLKDRGVEQIIIRYSGGGDSGQIDETTYSGQRIGEDRSAEDLSISKEVDTKIESVGYDLLENIGDWYNNDGGQGTVVISVADLYYEINAEYNPEQEGEYDHEKEEWIPADTQPDLWEEYYEGYLEKE